MKSFFRTGGCCSPYRLIPLFACLLLLNGTVSSSALNSLEVGMEVPDFSLSDLNGTTRNFAGLKGDKLTVVLFWATWGDNSKKALQQMQALHQKYKEAGLSVVGINVDKQDLSEKNLAEIRAVIAEQKITFPILIDRGLATFNSYGIIAVPSTLILDKNRVLSHELSGFPLIGADNQKQFVEATIENRSMQLQVAVTGYQPDKKAVRLWNMGVKTQRSERTAAQAKGWFEKAIAADPDFILPHISLGNLYYKQQNLTDAKKQFELVLQKKPEQVIALAALGNILLQEGDLTGAEQKLSLAIKLDEAYLPSYYLLGLLKGRQGNLEQALQWFKQAEELNPKDFKVFTHKALLFEELKDLPAAAVNYKKALLLIVDKQ